ncbi:GNAT family N-acetyltransferase [Haloferula sp. BvORR071]|uniref:GNAT family N-acetyltransferase n=1 Tax=Haloferula sp. BvORR071 TaxID=1396141 RepID=UPI002240FC46|nr:GNAT family N-acetyltransferase [Haloferula sp. BvORR071]
MILVENPMHTPVDSIRVLNVTQNDFERLAKIRAAAMRKSLARVGRFDPKGSRTRLLVSFAPEFTRTIEVDGKTVGFYAARRSETGVELEHLYILPKFQNRGIGSQVLHFILEEAERLRLPVFVVAVKESASNRFYRRHGFMPDGVGKWDNYYVRHSGMPAALLYSSPQVPTIFSTDSCKCACSSLGISSSQASMS